MFLKNESQDSSERFYQYKLEYPLLHPSEKDSNRTEILFRKLKSNSYLSVYRGFSPSNGQGYFIRLYFVEEINYYLEL